MTTPFLNTYTIVIFVELVTKPIYQVNKRYVYYVVLIHLSVDGRILVNLASHCHLHLHYIVHVYQVCMSFTLVLV